jgi:diguanylate cyclase (GGDEF)-like protein
MGVLLGNGGPSSMVTSLFFVWVALYGYWFFAPRIATVHIAIDAVLLAGALAVQDTAAAVTIWLLVCGTVVVVGVVVSLMRRQLIRAITIDPLTRLPMRHTLITAFAQELGRARRQGRPLCVAIIDIDGLKAMNDHHGHQAGDQLLVTAAQAWRRALRDTDVLVRFGGDEFVALLPDCDHDVAASLLERLRRACPAAWSAGLAWWEPGDTAADLLARADAELYRNKRAHGPSGRPPVDARGSTVVQQWSDLVPAS